MTDLFDELLAHIGGDWVRCQVAVPCQQLNFQLTGRLGNSLGDLGMLAEFANDLELKRWGKRLQILS